MAKSTRKPVSGKPARKAPAFPLTKHPRGYWCKHAAGKIHYFGRVDADPEGKSALEKWLAVKDYILNGLPPPADMSGATVKTLVNSFLNSKAALIRTGELSERTFRQYDTTCGRLVEALGPGRIIETLAPSDFANVREKLAEGRGPVSLGSEITVARMVFKYAYDQGFIDKPVKYGQSFDRPSRKTLRIERAKRGPRMFSAPELRAILDAAGVPMRAFVLLGANCAFGASDIAGLPKSAIDLGAGWIDYARGKTGIGRRIPLWPETAAAVREAIDQRPAAKDQDDDGLAFLTKYGRRWVKLNRKEGREGATPDDSLGKEFKKLLVELKLDRPGLGFYALRHMHETIGGESKDQVAVDALMGHVDGSTAAAYREGVSDERLQAVVETIRRWLWPETLPPADRASDADRPALKIFTGVAS